MKILFITNNLSRTGAPIVLLNLIKWLRKTHEKIEISLISLEGGDLKDEFKIHVHKMLFFRLNLIEKILNKIGLDSKIADNFNFNKFKIKNFKKYDLIYANTIVSVKLACILKNKSKNTKLLVHLHELEYAIKYHDSMFLNYASKIDHIIAVSKMVKKNVCENYKINKNKVSIIYPSSNIEITETLKQGGKFTVGGAGQVRWEKGPEIFIQIAYILKKTFPEKIIEFCWVGQISEIDKLKFEIVLEKLGLNNIVHFVGEHKSVLNYFKEFDVFALPSIEDPFPLVCIEAAMMKKPIICFKSCTGIEELLKEGGGYIVPFLDLQIFADKIIYYFDNPTEKYQDGIKSYNIFSKFTPDNQNQKIYKVIQNLIDN